MNDIKVNINKIIKKDINVIIIYTFKNPFNNELIKLFLNIFSQKKKSKLLILKNFVYNLKYENELLDVNKKYENKNIKTILLILENIDIKIIIPLLKKKKIEIYYFLTDPYIIYFLNNKKVYHYWKKLELLFLFNKNNKILNINKFYYFYTKENRDILSKMIETFSGTQSMGRKNQRLFRTRKIRIDKKLIKDENYHKIYNKIDANKMKYLQEKIKNIYLYKNKDILVFNEYEHLFKNYYYNDIKLKKRYIFIISLHKTGIQSINQFLEKNGYFVYHQYFHQDLFNTNFKNELDKYNKKYIKNNSLEKQKLINDFILNNKDILQKNKNKVCFSDTPWCFMYKEIYKILPESKFIYIHRNKYEWYESVLKFFGNNSSKMREVIYGKNYGSPLNNKDVYVKKFIEHQKDVIDFFKDKKNQLLIFNLKDENEFNTKLIYEFLNIENNYDIYIEHYNQHNDHLYV